MSDKTIVSWISQQIYESQKFLLGQSLSPPQDAQVEDDSKREKKPMLTSGK